MKRDLVLVCGDYSGERVDWKALCGEFGLQARFAADVNALAAAPPDVAAVVFDADSTPAWQTQAAELAREYPHVPVLLTHGFHSGPQEWEEEAVAGTLLRPLKTSECRQALCLLESKLKRRTPWNQYSAAMPLVRNAGRVRNGPNKVAHASRCGAPTVARSR